jgi:hypothetical protein
MSPPTPILASLARDLCLSLKTDRPLYHTIDNALALPFENRMLFDDLATTTVQITVTKKFYPLSAGRRMSSRL